MNLLKEKYHDVWLTFLGISVLNFIKKRLASIVDNTIVVSEFEVVSSNLSAIIDELHNCETEEVMDLKQMNHFLELYNAYPVDDHKLLKEFYNYITEDPDLYEWDILRTLETEFPDLLVSKDNKDMAEFLVKMLDVDDDSAFRCVVAWNNRDKD